MGRWEDCYSLDQVLSAIPLLPTTHKPKNRHGAPQTKIVSENWKLNFPRKMHWGTDIEVDEVGVGG